MKHTFLLTLIITGLFFPLSCNTNTHKSPVSIKAQELSALLNEPAFKTIESIEDTEVKYVTEIRNTIDKASGKALHIHSQIENKDIPEDLSDFKLYVMQVLGMIKSVDAIKTPFSEHTTYLIELLSDKAIGSNTSLESIKYSLLDRNTTIETYTQFKKQQEDYSRAIESFTLLLTDVLLSLDSKDVASGISKMTGPEMQEFLLSSMIYMENVLTFEKGRADDIIKAQSLYTKIN